MQHPGNRPLSQCSASTQSSSPGHGGMGPDPGQSSQKHLQWQRPAVGPIHGAAPALLGHIRAMHSSKGLQPHGAVQRGHKQ